MLQPKTPPQENCDSKFWFENPFLKHLSYKIVIYECGSKMLTLYIPFQFGRKWYLRRVMLSEPKTPPQEKNVKNTFQNIDLLFRENLKHPLKKNI